MLPAVAIGGIHDAREEDMESGLKRNEAVADPRKNQNHMSGASRYYIRDFKLRRPASAM